MAQYAAQQPQTSHLSVRQMSQSPSQMAQNCYRHHSCITPLRSTGSLAQLRPQYMLQDTPALPTQDAPGYLSEHVQTPPPPYEIRRTQSSSALSVAAEPLNPSASSKWKNALGELQYHASGIFSRPAITRKHYSVISHSTGLVWYKGPTTCIRITILSDGNSPIPHDRTIWLQQNGHSGGMGMAIKAKMGLFDGWIDVTPVAEVEVKHIPAIDERGLQRDLGKFKKKAFGRAKKHVPRETHFIRIPAAAKDGYYQLVLCEGSDRRKLLCTSPIFRVASTSTDVSVVRGASLSTMPVEMGIKAVSVAGAQVVKRYTGIAGAVVQSSAGKFAAKRSFKTATAVAVRGYQGFGGPNFQGAIQESWRRNRQQGSSALLGDVSMTIDDGLLGTDDGPQSPFPFKFDGKVTQGTGRSFSELGFRTANLRGVPDHVVSGMPGVYAAWILIKAATSAQHASCLHDNWTPAIVTIAPPRDATPTIAMPNAVRVYVESRFDTQFFNCQMKVLLMGYLHPAAPRCASAEELLRQHRQDVAVTVCSLDRPAWDADEVIVRMKALTSEKRVASRLDGMTGQVQQTVDKVPLHLAGVRSESALARDALVGKGGMWVRRD